MPPHDIQRPRSTGTIAVDLGCGIRKQPGAIGIDIAKVPGVDLVGDITKTLPFRESSVDRVYAWHVVEHLDDLMAFMAEVWRICKPGAIAYIRFPHGSSAYATWKDPTHKRAILLDTFEYFDPRTLEGILFGHYQPAKFEVVKRRLTYSLNADKPFSGDPWLPDLGRVERVVGRVIDGIANFNKKSQYYCERYWGNWVGMQEGHIWLRAIKER